MVSCLCALCCAYENGIGDGKLCCLSTCMGVSVSAMQSSEQIILTSSSWGFDQCQHCEASFRAFPLLIVSRPVTMASTIYSIIAFDYLASTDGRNDGLYMPA